MVLQISNTWKYTVSNLDDSWHKSFLPWQYWKHKVSWFSQPIRGEYLVSTELPRQWRIYMQRKQKSAEGPGTLKMQMKRNHKTYPCFSRETILWVQRGNVVVVEILCLCEIINAWLIREIFQWNYQNLSWIWILVVLDMDFCVLRLWETWLNTFTFCHFDFHFLLKIINYHRSFMKKSQISDLNSSKE